MKHETDRVNEEYFIDPFGKIYKYKGDDDLEEIISLHYEIAAEIYPNEKYPDDKLMKLGWLQIGSSCYNSPIMHKLPTQAQINTMDLQGERLDRLCILIDGYYVKFKDLDEYGNKL